MNIIKRFFTGWTPFEKAWLGLSVLTLAVLQIPFHSSPLAIISAITNIICVVLVAKGKISNYYWGIVATATYAYLCFTVYNLQGEFQLNAFFYLPTQFVGLYLWHRHAKKQQDAIAGEDVYAKRLTKMQWLIGTPVIIVLSILYILFLHSIHSSQVGLDGVAVVLSVTAQILMLLRYAEQWVLWIVVDVISVALWVTTLISTQSNDVALLVMFVAFTVNAVYGYFNWLKLAKASEKKPTDAGIPGNVVYAPQPETAA